MLRYNSVKLLHSLQNFSQHISSSNIGTARIDKLPTEIVEVKLSGYWPNVVTKILIHIYLESSNNIDV